MWSISADGVVASSDGTQVKAMTTRLDIVWRPKGSGGGADQVIVSWQHTYMLNAAMPYNVDPYSATAMGAAVPARPGDQLVLIMSVVSGPTDGLWEPDGDGSFRNGTIPHFTLP